jgi:hypothetical protein
MFLIDICSAADPVLLYPPDPEWSYGRIRDKQTKFVNSLYKKKLVGSGIRCFFTPRIRDGAMVGSGIKHPGSATLASTARIVRRLCMRHHILHSIAILLMVHFLKLFENFKKIGISSRIRIYDTVP